MLTLEEKGVPYNKLLIDELNMPEWCEHSSMQLLFRIYSKLFMHTDAPTTVSIFVHRASAYCGHMTLQNGVAHDQPNESGSQ